MNVAMGAIADAESTGPSCMLMSVMLECFASLLTMATRPCLHRCQSQPIVGVACLPHPYRVLPTLPVVHGTAKVQRSPG